MAADPREIHRTRPDDVIHDPTGGRERPWDDEEFYWLNEHMTIRTNRGEVWYSVSPDQGRTWDEARPMRTRDGGPKLRHPCSPCPVFSLGDRRYLLLFHDNDGYVFGADSRWHVRNRRPTYASVAEFRPGAEQPLWWGAKRLLIDNGAVPWGPPGRGRFESAAYVSMTCVAGRRVLWYPDRKGFLLGTRLDDERLAGRGG